MSEDVPAKVIAESQKLTPDAPIELFQVDATGLGGELHLFHNQRAQGAAVLSFGGLSYQPIPIQASGFAHNGSDRAPTPKIEIGNQNAMMSALVDEYDDLRGALVRRIRTFRKHLDDGSDPDGTALLSDDLYSVNRKTSETRESVEFELVSAMDVEGAMIPKRRVLHRCAWRYKDGLNCPYVGPLSSCAKTVSACEEHFPDQPLPIGGFPAVERIALRL